ncbi:MAG: hypothetical protein KAW67_08540, partial [Candidatus Eisenbacteria sp.]|nr:hypothetical protein [Candidatus Eisenbacteria bacterium]
KRRSRACGSLEIDRVETWSPAEEALLASSTSRDRERQQADATGGRKALVIASRATYHRLDVFIVESAHAV